MIARRAGWRAQSALCMQMAEERAPDGFARLEDVFAEGELEGIAARYKAVAGFSKEAVAAKVAAPAA